MKILKRIKEISRSQISRERALTTTEQISAITHLVNSLEVLANDRNPRNAALVDWNLIKDEYSWAPRHVHDFLGFVSRPGVSRAIHVARAASAISLMIPGTHRHHRAAAGMFLSLTSVITSPRQHFGTDGSDQVAFLAQGVAALARMGEQQPRTVDSCLWFVGLQSSLSYFASGVAKAAGPLWRSGEALPLILRTEAYGDSTAYRLVKKYPAAARAATTAVLLLECGFPVVFLAKGRMTLPVLISAGTFHVINARVMGLSRFVWAFLSTYPAILYITQEDLGSVRYEQ
ncbi:hypothetical protein OHU11_39240 [Streptomyces sp. NBC_00257]|uniref:hypothetical protein n=1 Tax=Streptomyces TaxID=1883 RepID=UPI00224CB509|nr:MULTISPECIES: hypothetical protein [unclassified Streptomyces]WTB52343.1 hypothetical protein OG832_03810 [Streptomyces sp. NBC_00826]WTH94766.1 hypothetical protein OIC43_39875 [Streptomyces sp. NBC_00825]WTI03500.1 hypothetical protein OHA23_39850 [Streptomyces sp. NBC_00822]MCX4869065.1 hypothetical protein [Streptomyces sp. NBC_00906]MCX4900303.1 hypothetical protein [Streptomyces sp. NBC_00892]